MGISNLSQIAVNSPDATPGEEVIQQKSARDQLVSYVCSRVRDWEDHRNNLYQQRWNEYYRLWRGVWIADDKTRQSERSRLIAPGLAQAVETMVAELEEATFSREFWFDLDDDVKGKADRQPTLGGGSATQPAAPVGPGGAPQGGAAQSKPNTDDQVKRFLLEDINTVNGEQAIVESYLNAAIFGTGICKIVPDEITTRKIATRQNEDGSLVGGVESKEEMYVFLEPIRPENFVIDTAVNQPGKNGIEMAHGMAHVFERPRHAIEAKQTGGVYYKGAIPVEDSSDAEDWAGKGEIRPPRPQDSLSIIEYYGLVPTRLLEAAQADQESVDLDDDDLYDLVEAQVTCASDNFLLRAQKNPSLMSDRPIVAFAFDVVPGRFWGRGVAEKAYNPQKAQDALLRGQLDGLAMSVHPMMAGDVTRLPRGQDLGVSPGKFVLTNGNPNEVLREFRFPSVDPLTYQATGDLERMITVATGAADSAAPLRTNRRNETVGGLSIIMSGMLKRAKRTLRQIEHNFLNPLVHKVLWRYMELRPDRYPRKDMKFVVRNSLGQAAREVETAQLTQLIQFVPPESKPFWEIVASIMEMSSVPNKEKILGLLRQTIDNPPSKRTPEQEQAARVAPMDAQTKIGERVARTEKTKAQTAAIIRDLQTPKEGGK